MRVALRLHAPRSWNSQDLRMLRVEVEGLAQELQQGHGESGGADGMSDEYRAEVFVDAHLELAQIGFGGE